MANTNNTNSDNKHNHNHNSRKRNLRELYDDDDWILPEEEKVPNNEEVIRAYVEYLELKLKEEHEDQERLKARSSKYLRAVHSLQDQLAVAKKPPSSVQALQDRLAEAKKHETDMNIRVYRLYSANHRLSEKIRKIGGGHHVAIRPDMEHVVDTKARIQRMPSTLIEPPIKKPVFKITKHLSQAVMFVYVQKPILIVKQDRGVAQVPQIPLPALQRAPVLPKQPVLVKEKQSVQVEKKQVVQVKVEQPVQVKEKEQVEVKEKKQAVGNIEAKQQIKVGFKHVQPRNI